MDVGQGKFCLGCPGPMTFHFLGEVFVGMKSPPLSSQGQIYTSEGQLLVTIAVIGAVDLTRSSGDFLAFSPGSLCNCDN